MNLKMGEEWEAEGSLVDILAYMWKQRKWLYGTVFVFLILGIVTSYLIHPVYYAEALISPKSTQRGNDPLSQLRSFQLGIGDPDFNKMGILLTSYEMSEKIVKDHNLAPILFPEEWDSEKKTWKDPETKPNQRKAAEELNKHLVVETDTRKNVMRVGIRFYDSSWTPILVNYFTSALNEKMRFDVVNDANVNRQYLEAQLDVTADPILAQKLKDLIGYQIEKAMLVNSQSIDVLTKPLVPKTRMKPQRKKIVIVSFFLGVFAYGFGALAAYFFSKNGEVLIERLRNA